MCQGPGLKPPANPERQEQGAAASSYEFLEQAEGLGAVADKEVLGLAIVIEDHLVGLAAETRLLVTAEGSARGIEVIAVGPAAASLDATADAIRIGTVAGPDA